MHFICIKIYIINLVVTGKDVYRSYNMHFENFFLKYKKQVKRISSCPSVFVLFSVGYSYNKFLY